MKVVGVLAILLMLVIFVLQNTEVVSVRLLFWDLSMSRVVLVLCTTLLGFACGYLFATLSSRRRPPKLGQDDA